MPNAQQISVRVLRQKPMIFKASASRLRSIAAKLVAKHSLEVDRNGHWLATFQFAKELAAKFASAGIRGCTMSESMKIWTGVA